MSTSPATIVGWAKRSVPTRHQVRNLARHNRVGALRFAHPTSAKLLDRAPFLVACLMLVVLVAIYGSLRDDVFTLEELNLDAAASMTLLLAATGQTIVLLRGGIDLSIGGMISFGTVIAATQFGDSWTTATAWGLAIVAIGLLV